MSAREVSPDRRERLALVGMAVLTDRSPDLATFERSLYSGVTESKPVVKDEKCEALPQKEDDLLLKLIANLRAGLRTGPDRIAVLIVRAGVLAEATNRRFSPAEDKAAYEEPPFFDNAGEGIRKEVGYTDELSLQGNPFNACLLKAQALLAEEKYDYTIVAGAAAVGGIETAALRAGVKSNPGSIGLGYAQQVEGWNFGGGAAGIVFARRATARANQDRVYAVLEGTGFAAKENATPRIHIIPTYVSADTIRQSIERAFNSSGARPTEIGYLEVVASGFTPLDIAEITALKQAYHEDRTSATCAIGSAQAQEGYLPSVAGILGFIRAALCLHDRIIPPEPGWTAPKRPELFAETPFYVASDPRTWFQPAPAGPRLAATNCIGWDGSCLHTILAEEPTQLERASRLLVRPETHLFPIAADSIPDLLQSLRELREAAAKEVPLPELAVRSFDVFTQRTDSQWAAGLIAQDQRELQKEIETALRDIPSVMEKNTAWQTPGGSYFTPTPAGQKAKIALVYPGAFNSYLGLGRDLFALFPRLHSLTQNLTPDLGETIQERLLYPRSMAALDADQQRHYENQLNADAVAMITSGSLIAVIYTYLLREVFHIQADTALGYSLGEIGMLFAMGIWDQADEVSAALRGSPLFRDELSGPQNVVRKHWSLPPSSQYPSQNFSPIWENYFLMASAEKVAAALESEERVYLTHTNTPRQVVIGGSPEACKRVISSVKCTALKAPFDFALHCEAMNDAYDSLVRLLSWPVAGYPEATLYTAAGNVPLKLDSENISNKIATMLCTPLDFPALIRRVFDDGNRIFIELGANANCTKWIEECLKGETFAAIAINRKNTSDLVSLARMLARLASHRVPLDLTPLYQPMR